MFEGWGERPSVSSSGEQRGRLQSWGQSVGGRTTREGFEGCGGSWESQVSAAARTEEQGAVCLKVARQGHTCGW